MAVRGFDGVDDIITCSPGSSSALDGGPITIGAWIKALSVKDQGIFGGYSVDNFDMTWAIYYGTDGKMYGARSDFTGFTGYSSGNWRLVLYSKPTGTATVRFHVYNPTTTTWTHGNSTTSATDGTTPIVGIDFGRAWGDFAHIRLGVAAVWNSNLSDATIEGFGLETSLSNWTSSSPVGLWAFNQAAVTTAITDLTGNGANQTARTGTVVVTGDDPPGFSFSSDQNLNIPFHQQTTSIFAPTITNQSALSLTPARLESSVQFFNLTIENQAALILSPARLESTAQLFVPTITHGDQFLHPARIEPTVQFFNPTVELQTNLDLNVGFLASSSQLFVPIIENQVNLSLNVPFRTFTSTFFNPTVFNEGDELFEPILVGNGSLADQIMAGLIDQGFLTGTLADREYNRLLSKLTLSVGDNLSIADLYSLADEENRIAGLEVTV